MTTAADAAFEFDAASFSGRIQSEFDVQLAGEGSRRELRGTALDRAAAPSCEG